MSPMRGYAEAIFQHQDRSSVSNLRTSLGLFRLLREFLSSATGCTPPHPPEYRFPTIDQ